MSSTPDAIASLVASLMAANCFEDAATAVLQAMLGHVDEHLRRQRIPGIRLLRGVVHVRPEGTYQRLFGIEHGSGVRVEGTGYLTSASVWRWIFEHRCSVSIDVQRGTIRPWLPSGPIERHDQSGAEGAVLPGHATRERMLGRDSTHVHVVPLRTPGGGITGMITLEAKDKSPISQGLLWDVCQEDLAVLANIATAYLTALPPRPVSKVRTDELLPVVGPTTAGIVELLSVFAQQEETILISGPTGSGKSRLARWCHAHSRRRDHHFESVDLLSVPEELQMAELFGWKRGAFTGAVKDTPGAITRAALGTVFIDEIDKLSLKAQAGLLRVLEERRYRPLGDEASERRAEVRFIVGTNADLRGSVQAGRFREDLYYRINVLPIRLPPLGERLDELPSWVDYMLLRRQQECGEGSACVTPEAVTLLLQTPWPGNLRQLDNIVRRAYALAMAARGSRSSPLILERSHFERALAYEGVTRQDSLVAVLWRAARAFVRETQRRAGTSAPLTLEHCEVLRGMVLGAALDFCKDRDKAFELLGQQMLLKNRNHHRALRRELERVRAFVQASGVQPDSDLALLLEQTEDS